MNTEDSKEAMVSLTRQLHIIRFRYATSWGTWSAVHGQRLPCCHLGLESELIDFYHAEIQKVLDGQEELIEDNEADVLYGVSQTSGIL